VAGVTAPTGDGGLGFDFKWNMGWMHDTLAYLHEDPIHRRYHHDRMTFGLVYAFSERFVLPLSHDEVVHGKGSLAAKMPGDAWQRLATLRAYFSCGRIRARSCCSWAASSRNGRSSRTTRRRTGSARRARAPACSGSCAT
jgi:hypothetical protein